MQITKNRITITYESGQENDAKKALKFLENNSFLTDSVAEEKTIKVDVKDFYSLANKMVLNKLKTFEFDNIINYKNFLLKTYIISLRDTVKDDSKPLLKFKKKISPDFTYFLVAIKYCNYDVDKIVDLLDKRENGIKLFYWIRDNVRYDAFNYLLNTSSYSLKEGDSFFYDNLDWFLDNMKEKIPALEQPNSNLERLEELAPEKIDELFKEFLNHINAPDSWKQDYSWLREEKLIYFNAENEFKFTKVSDTTRDFIFLTSKFIHFITSKNGNERISLYDFPTTYYENIAAQFLVSKGYSDEIVTDTIDNQNRACKYFYDTYFSLLSEVNKYKNNGQIVRDDIIEEGFTEEQADATCDNRTFKLLSEGGLMITTYKYLVGTMLTNQVLASNRADTNEKMIDITENLDSYNAIDIMNYFNTEKKLIKK